MPPSILAAAVLVAMAPTGLESDAKAMFLKHWQIAKEFTLAVAGAMPAEGYDFKPNPEQLTFGYLMIHIANQNSDSCAVATGTEPLAKPAATDTATFRTFDGLEVRVDGMKEGDRRYITLATGADFADVVPLRGVILGGRGQTMEVAVSVVPR